MVKKIKLMVALIVCSIMVFSLSSVKAYSGENLDKDGKMYLGGLIVNGKGTVTVRSSITDYNLYSQSIEISDEKYNAIKGKSDEIENTSKEYQDEVDALADELDTLREELNAIEDKTSEEYTQKKSVYDAKVDAYQTRVGECEESLENLNNEYMALWPDFDDSKWVKCEDKSFYVYNEDFRGNKNFFVWLKLVEPGDVITYNVGYTVQEGSIKPEETNQLITTSQTDFSLNVGESKEIAVTVTPEGTSVTWKSDNESIATVENGKVTAKGEGTATITATTEDGKSSISVKVTCVDNTKSNKVISKTGVSSLSAILVVAGIAIAIILFKKSKSIKIK